jgi:hypothetical protein
MSVGCSECDGTGECYSDPIKCDACRGTGRVQDRTCRICCDDPCTCTRSR